MKTMFLKKISIVASIVAIAIIAGMFVGCQKEEKSETKVDYSQLSEEAQKWVHEVVAIYAKNPNVVIYTIVSNGIYTISDKFDKLTISRLKSGNEKTWSDWKRMSDSPIDIKSPIFVVLMDIIAYECVSNNLDYEILLTPECTSNGTMLYNMDVRTREMEEENDDDDDDDDDDE